MLDTTNSSENGYHLSFGGLGREDKAKTQNNF